VPNIQGDAPLDPNAAGAFYVSARIQGTITLFDLITLSGFIGFDVGSQGVRILGA